jgi:hypothetical protein
LRGIFNTTINNFEFKEECPCKVGIIYSKKGYYGINCENKCEFNCGDNGHCIDKGLYIRNNSIYLSQKTRFDGVLDGMWIDTPNGYKATISCRCFNGWSGYNCNLYAGDWLRIIKTTFNWALFPLIFIFICLFQPIISKKFTLTKSIFNIQKSKMGRV